MATETSPVYAQPFFMLQLVFAQKISTLAQQPFEQAILHYTAIYRIFGLDWSMDPTNPVWQKYIQGQQQTTDTAAFTYQFYLQRYEEIPKFTDQEHWGCFAYDYHPESRTIHFHFSDADRSGYGPLSHHRIDARKAELKTILEEIKHRHPEAIQVRGGSWLYNWESYRRLFPPAFGQSAQKEKEPGLTGRNIWTQFLRRGWRVHEETMAVFLERVAQLERVEDYAQCFPYPVLQTLAPIQLFYDFYQIS